eukprot:TRINITY_DN4205_c0_g2_i1.p1 TRINITY_DN4205_c0_g2~~TRINITY_DN4205_c0_g2_i1.p1  ORF type:complete len:1015 (+),score=365.20 TRINITY_DN4205_c0_g2_i1:94-3138(+)
MARDGRLAVARRTRSMTALSQCRHYIRRAMSHTMLLVLMLVLTALSEQVSALAYNNTVVYNNKLMNFGMDAMFGKALNDTAALDELEVDYKNLGYETGEDLDQSNSNYDERRWKFDHGVDMVVRYEKGYTFCPSYVLFPAENVWPLGLRAVLYLLALVYLFLGVAIVSDMFMASIEEITAEKEKIVLRKGDDGGEQEVVITYTVWNDTVANLTLLALGSSAPEILLSVVETVSTLDKVPGELGPSTIVGSAAFNLLCITGICMLAVEEVKKINEFGVFAVTSATSLFAYLWMLVVLQFVSPDIVEIWEAILTLAFFPIMVIMAFIADRKPWQKDPAEEEVPQNQVQVQVSEPNGEGAGERRGSRPNSSSMRRVDSSGKLLATPALGARRTTVHRILEAHVSGASTGEVAQIISAAKANHGRVTEESIKEELDRQRAPKKLNAGHYRMNTIRNMITKKSVLNKIKSSKQDVSLASSSSVLGIPPASPRNEQQRAAALEAPDCGVISFEKNSYSVLEGEGTVNVVVTRKGGVQGEVKAAYSTTDLTAQCGVNYNGTDGIVSWGDGDAEDKVIRIGVINNDAKNPDLLFTVKLDIVHESRVESHLGLHRLAVVTIVDDDLAGEIRFASTYVQVADTQKVVRIELVREKGVTGSLMANYKTMDGIGRRAAVAGKDYTATSGTVLFSQGDTSKVVEIPIEEGSSFEVRDEHFFVTITDVEGKAGGRIGSVPKVRVIIQSDSEMMHFVEEVLQKVKEKVDKEGTWAQQFRDAMDFGPDDDGNQPSNIDYLMHFLTLFWKVLFSVIPPPMYGGGIPAFVVSLFMIGLITAMVAEIAGLVGCTMGLKDQVTAITFVALGTSLPDTFASKQAVEEEEYADAAVGNVTGSNSVNVFLGLGLPWVIASVYYSAKGECYIVPSGALSFSVLMFTVCAVICIVCLLVLRMTQGGEIGGKHRKAFAVLFVFLWFIYILFSSLNVYGHLPQFPGTENRCPCSCANRGILPWARELADTAGSCIAAGCPV